MKSRTFPKRVTDIEEPQFWSAMRVPRHAEQSELLAEAIRLGKQGSRAKAYRRLFAYHRETLGVEWEAIRARVLAAPRPNARTLKDLLNHRIAVWHKEVVQFGPKIDWRPESLPSDCISGFHYMGWFRPAVNVFIRTGDERYREFMIDLLTQYCDMPRSSAWTPKLKQAVFSILATQAKWPLFLSCYLALIHDGSLPPRLGERLLKMILGFGRALDHSLREFTPHNIFAAGNSALLHIARTFPEFRESPRWDRKAIGFVVQHAREGFFSDGGNRERVWGYGAMHVQGLAKPYRIARRTGGMGEHDKLVLAALRKACRWYAKTATPGPERCFPSYGDAGWHEHDHLHTIESMARGLPVDAENNFGVDRTRSCILRPSGFAIMRNGDDERSTYVNIDFGKFAGWHSHWDLLSMNLWSQGKPMLEELCRFGPYANPLDTMFRAPESHNLLLIDGMIYDSRGIRGRDVAWFSNDDLDYFSATHRAYAYFVFGRDGRQVSPNIEALVRRTVLLVKDPGYVLVMDSVRNLSHANFNRAISQYWHSPRPFRQIGPDLARIQGSPGCLLAYARREGLHRLDTGVDFEEDEVSHIGEAYDRYSLRARRWMPLDHKGNVGFATLLFPFRGKTPGVTIKALRSEGGSPWEADAFEIRTPAGRDTLILNPERRSGFSLGGEVIAERARVKLGKRRGEVIVP